MAALIPDMVNLRALLARNDLGRWLPEVRACGMRAGLPPFETFHSPTSGPAKPISTFDQVSLVNNHVRFEAPDHTFLGISTPANLAGTLVQASCPVDNKEDKCRQAMHMLSALLMDLFLTRQLEEGYVERIGADLEAVPLTPVSQGFVALVTTEAVVNAAYRQPAAFWNAWDRHELGDTRHLLMRGLEASTSAEWFGVVFEREWALARAARPGQTRIGVRRAPPGCEKLLMAGSSCLREAGKHDGHVELAGFVPEGAHIPPWEILYWNEMLFRGRCDDGAPVSSLRVVFRTEQMALAEASPLLDIGAKVVFLGRDGEYHPVT